MRVENIKDPSDHIPALLERVKPEYLTKTYQLCPHVDPCENPCSYTDRETMKHMDEDERACKKNRYTTVCIHCTYTVKSVPRTYALQSMYMYCGTMSVLFMLFNMTGRNHHIHIHVHNCA